MHQLRDGEYPLASDILSFGEVVALYGELLKLDHTDIEKARTLPH